MEVDTEQDMIDKTRKICELSDESGEALQNEQ